MPFTLQFITLIGFLHPLFLIPFLVVLFNKEINYHFFIVFGCACYTHTLPYATNKLQFRSIFCTFLGYSSCHKGYKCLGSNGKIFSSKDVIFDEHTFPFTLKLKLLYCPLHLPTFYLMGSFLLLLTVPLSMLLKILTLLSHPLSHILYSQHLPLLPLFSQHLPLLDPPIPCEPIPNLVLSSPIPNLVLSSLVIFLPYFLVLQSSKLSPLVFGDKQCNLNRMPLP